MSAADIFAGSPPADATPPADGGTPPAPAGDKPWFETIEDAELKGYAANKGWKDPKDLLVGYKNLEKLVGQDKLPIPKDPTDAEGWAKVYDKLGRPQDPKEYGLKVPEGADASFAQAASKTFHELGLNVKQAQALQQFYDLHVAEAVKGQEIAFAQQSEKELTELRYEWAGNYETNVETVRRAVREFDIDGETVAKIEQAVGTKAFFQMFNRIGKGLLEGNFKEGTTSSRFGMDANAAKAKLAELKADQGWTKRYLSGDVEAKAEMERLQRLAAS